MSIAPIAIASTDQASGNISFTHGLTLLSGDVVVAFINVNGPGNTVTDNNGSTNFTEDDHAANPDSASAYVFRRVCGASEPTAYAFTLGSSDRSSISLRQYRGVDASVWDVAPSASTRSTGSSDTTAEAPACTIATAGACGLVLMADDFTPTTTTYSSIDNGYANVRSEEGQEYQVTADKTGLSTGSTGVTTITSSANVSWVAWQVALKPSSATLEQEGFRFGVDDGNEASHTWEAAQDTNISTAAGESRLLRLLVNATGDPAAIAFKLKYQKNGSGGYATVPIGAATSPTLSWGAAGTIAYSSSGGTSVAPTYPSGITVNSALILVVGQKPSSANGGTVTTPTGWTLQGSLTGANDGNTGGYTTTLGADTGNTNIFVYTKDTVSGSESGTLSVTVGTNGVCWANIYRIQASDTCTWSYACGVGKDTSAGNVSIATGSMSITAGDHILAGMVIPTDVTTPAQFSSEALAQTGTTFGAVSEVEEPDSGTGNDIGGFLCQAGVSSGSGSGAVTLTATAGGTTTNVKGPGFVLRVRCAAVNNDFYITTSANITAGGEATTARLTAPSAKSTSDFVTGRRWDDENGTDTTNITTDDYSEFEYFLAVRSGLSASDYFDSRIYNGDTALDTYTTTPRWTISSATSLTVADATHTHAADAIVLTASNYLAVTDATHNHAADAIALTASSHLTVTDATHVHAADAITLTLSVLLSVTDATHTHAADAIGLTSTSYLAVTDTTHTHAADAIALTANNTLTVADATHTHSADAITLALSVALVVQDATHTHASDAITLSVGISLTVADATHAHAADAIVLTASNYLAVTEATHTHAADAIALTASNYLAVTDATHTHAADAIALTSVSHLVVQDATHEHATDAITLATNGSATLTVTDATHTHAADAIALTANSYLAVTDAAHTHAVDAITLALLYSLSVDDATHLHASDAVTLTANSYLVVQDATHVHTVDAITFVSAVSLGIAYLSTSLVETATLSDANLWNASLSDGAHDLAGLSDGSIWSAALNNQAHESAEVDDQPL